MSIPLSILLVEDSEDDTELLVIDLKRGGYDPFVKRVESAHDFVNVSSTGLGTS
ncbi:MAG: hypothetical protein CSYNP_00911 [Syntrophus sp. SKADARSKE-3]|nr:hypothetical protein [Syntrophus sp. SKADARSKE-3]